MKKNYCAILLITIVFTLIINKYLYSQDGNKSLFLDNTNWLYSGDYVDCGIPQFPVTDKITVCAWVKEIYKNGTDLHEGGYKWATIATLDNHAARDNGQFWLQHNSDDTRFEWAVYSNSRQYIFSTTNPSLNKWYFVCAVYDGSNSPRMRLYVNGVLESTSDATSGNIRNVDPTKYMLNIGRMPSSYRFLSGYIDDLRIYWGTALTTDQIRQQMYSKSTIVNTNLVRYYTFDQTSGIGVIDSANSGIINATYYSAIVDVHGTVGSNTGFDRNLKIIQDGEKTWADNVWVGKTLVTVAGRGFGVNVDRTIVSNLFTNQLTLDTWVNSNSAYDPISDIPGTNPPNMTYFAVKDVNAVEQWSNSTAPLCNNWNYIKTQTPTTVGPAGGNITGTITTTPNDANNIALYQWGTTTGDPVTTGETFPGVVNKRSNIVWGIQKWGTVTTNLVFDFSAIGGLSSNVRLLRRTRDDTAWIDVTASASLNFSQSTFTLNNVTASYEFALGEDENSPMPVEIKTFYSNIIENNIELNWITSSEINNSGFEVQRMINNQPWQFVGFVKAMGSEQCGYSYKYFDNFLQPGIYKYRLKQIDLNGNFKYYYLNSDVVLSQPKHFELKQNYPNPFNPETKIEYSVPDKGIVDIIIYDITGKEISHLINKKYREAGYYSAKFEGNSLPAGVYFYKFYFKSGSSTFSSTKKMVLLK
ncbi:MAG: T9SS type A sorting domain-containing protein [Ignavibacteriae bacterium]|nr:T9SS type A sorting domain-containing protein [Ignavibacteriota bacterium]